MLTSSATLRAGTDELTMSTKGTLATIATGTKSFTGIIRELAVNAGIDRERRAGRHQQRITVRGRLCLRFDADDRSGPRLVSDDDRLAECPGQFLADNPRQQIGPSARRIGHDQT